MNGTGLCASTLKRTTPQWQEPSRCMAGSPGKGTNCDDHDAYTAPVRNIVFIGGGNMAQALVGGLVKGGRPGASIIVIEPSEGTRRRLVGQFGVSARSAPGPLMEMAEILVWAVKPQNFEIAAGSCAGLVAGALQVSVMAGVRSDTVVAATASERVIRVMPNTPALIGQGIAGLFARPAVTDEDRADAIALLAPTGELIWVGEEVQLDAVTALSGSGPAYVFLLLESLHEARRQMGLAPAVARRLGRARGRVARLARRAAPDRDVARRHHGSGDGRSRHARRARRFHRRRPGGARQGRGA